MKISSTLRPTFIEINIIYKGLAKILQRVIGGGGAGGPQCVKVRVRTRFNVSFATCYVVGCLPEKGFTKGGGGGHGHPKTP